MTGRENILRLAIATAILAVAAVIHFTLGFGAPDRSVPATLDLPLDGSWAEAPAFRPHPPGSYRVSLELDRRFPHREMECLADVGSPEPASTAPGRRTDCPPGFDPLGVEWRLLEDGRPARLGYDFGPHAGEYSGATVGRSFVMVDLARGRTYQLRARTTDSPASSAVTRPRLRIAYGDMAELVVQALFWSALAILLAFVGAVLLIEALRLIRRAAVAERV